MSRLLTRGWGQPTALATCQRVRPLLAVSAVPPGTRSGPSGWEGAGGPFCLGCCVCGSSWLLPGRSFPCVPVLRGRNLDVSL